MESEEELDLVDREIRDHHSLSIDECLYFFEVERGDASDFKKNTFSFAANVRQASHPARKKARSGVPNAFAALLIDLESTTGRVPHAYFKWDRGAVR